MKVNKTLAIFGISLLSLGSAYAGVGSSGGGAGIICKDPKSGPTTVTVLDYYESLRDGIGPHGWIAGGPLFESGPFKNIYSNGDRTIVMNERFLGELTFALHYYPSLMREVGKKAKEIGDPFEWTPAPLRLRKDVDLGLEIPKDCELMQIALRVNDHFYINPLYLSQLSKSQQPVLQLHEAVYALAAEKTKLNSAAPVRSFFKSLYQAAMMFDDSPGYKLAVETIGINASIIFNTVYLSQDDLRDLLEGEDLQKALKDGRPYDAKKLELIRNKFESLLNDHRLNTEDRESIKSLLPKNNSSVNKGGVL